MRSLIIKNTAQFMQLSKVYVTSKNIALYQIFDIVVKCCEVLANISLFTEIMYQLYNT